MTFTDTTTTSFNGIVVPPDVQQAILDLLVSGAHFAPALTKLPTNSTKVAWPTAQPTGWKWLAELDQFPQLALGDSSYVAELEKVGGIIPVSNELAHDSQISIMGSLGRTLQDSLSVVLDHGLLYGEGPGVNEPVGIVPAAPAADGADLLAAVAVAVGSIGDAGGTADKVAATPSTFATANTERGATGQLLYPQGMAAALGLEQVGVPGMGADVLVFDSSRVFLAVNGELSQVDLSNDFYFDRDAAAIRVKSRITVAVPDLAKAVRKLTITPAANGAQASGASESTRASGASKSTAK